MDIYYDSKNEILINNRNTVHLLSNNATVKTAGTRQYVQSKCGSVKRFVQGSYRPNGLDPANLLNAKPCRNCFPQTYYYIAAPK